MVVDFSACGRGYWQKALNEAGKRRVACVNEAEKGREAERLFDIITTIIDKRINT